MSKLYQISTPTCPPCRHYREMIGQLPEEVKEHYVYLDATVDAKMTHELAIKFKVSSVPRFLILDEDLELVTDLGHKGKEAISYLLNASGLNDSDEEE